MAPIESQLLRGQFQSHASFLLPVPVPVPASGDDDIAEGTFKFLLSWERHASGIVYFDQSTAAVVIEVELEVEAFYESEEALLYALRRSRGQYGIGVLVSLVWLSSAAHMYDVTWALSTGCSRARM